MKAVTIIGARPQFIKSAPVSSALRAIGIQEIIVHTGQHYDDNMSDIFFRELSIPTPDHHLEIGSASHGRQTGAMLSEIEQCLIDEKPDVVIVFGDTNSTLAGALAASKLRIRVVHVEAGLRSWNRDMPEEINRILTDHCADLLFCPSRTAVDNLAREGISSGVHLVGDTMLDALLSFKEIALERSTIIDSLHLVPDEYVLATLHRPYNTDDEGAIGGILRALEQIGMPVVFPVHPRTRKIISDIDHKWSHADQQSVLKMIDPVGYLDILALQTHAKMILTDSGGMQKEAYFLNKPCITLRPETEWVELVEAGVNHIVGSDTVKIIDTVQRVIRNAHCEFPAGIYGDGASSQNIANIIANAYK